MATDFEKAVTEEYQKQGWSVLTNGWPDLFLWKEGDNGPIVKCVEIKSKNDSLRPNQKTLLNLLSAAGIQVRIAYEGYGYGNNYGKEPYPFFELTTEPELEKREKELYAKLQKEKNNADSND